jgi:prepilin-type N-terminal cleavage/methylation domain-containing protein
VRLRGAKLLVLVHFLKELTRIKIILKKSHIGSTEEVKEMKNMKRNMQGFTLIELLIVVAIIAILAAIAIPNFLAAQVRAKVSRVRADIQSLCTATEAYAVDNNAYPLTNGWYGPVNQQTGGIPDKLGYYATYFGNFKAGLRDQPAIPYLTTPISYISAIPFDPFNGPNPETYAFYSEQANQDADLGGVMYYQWFSVGPDGIWDSDPLIYQAIFQGTTMPYDPSNGTVSNGDIVVVGGELQASQLDVY